MRWKSYFWLEILLLLVVFGQPVRADVNGSIWGTVRDPSGAVVPNASVFLHNVSTGLKRQVSTQATGEYEFLVVPVGRGYALEVQAPGFQKFVQSDITLLVNQRFRVEVDLVVGTASQQVTVSAAPGQVETASTQLGNVIEDDKMTGLPLNGRSYIDLLGLQAGVVPMSSSVANNDRPISGELNSGIVSVNGNRETGNSFLVNGGDVEESRNNGASVSPTLDSIQEFRVLTNSYDAEYGRFSGGIVNVVTKSGTNDLHGSLFEFLRNDKLDSRNFFDRDQTAVETGQEIPGSARGIFKRNQFGGTAGGHILKNRLFFFGDYQGTRERRGLTSGTMFVPSLAERGGDFSDVAATSTSPLTSTVKGDSIPGDHSLDEVLTSRLGYLVKSGEPYWAPGCNTAADAQAGTCVFPDQKIPQSAFGPVTNPTLGFIPTPTGSIAGRPYWSSSSEAMKLRDDKFGLRITLNNKRTGDWSIYYHWDDSTQLSPFPQANVPGFPGATMTRAQQVNLSNTYIFGPTAVNELRLNYTRMVLRPNTPTGKLGVGPVDSFGFVSGGLGIVPAIPQAAAMPGISIGGDYYMVIGPPNVQSPQINNSSQITENFSKLAGKHSLKFGADFRKFQINLWNIAFPSGSYWLGGGETGNAFADYLLGTPDWYGQSSAATLFSRAPYLGAFAQDSYKLKPNFTANLGLRWEVSPFFSEAQNQLNVIHWGQASTLFPGAPTGWVVPGDPGIPKTISPTSYKKFAPRVGLAYSPGFKDGELGRLFGGPGKTSMRAAFGVYYLAVEDVPAAYSIADAPFGNFFNGNFTYMEEPFKDRRHGNDPGQRFPSSPAKPGQLLDWSQYLPIAGSPGVPPDNVLPSVMHWNFNIQRELPKSTILTMGYVGTRGRHLLAQRDENVANPARCLQIAQILTAQGRAGEACGPWGENQVYDLNGDGIYTLGVDAFGTRAHSITSGQFASRGLLDFGRGIRDNANIATSDYDALQVSAEKRMGALRLLAAYTWSKSLDNSSNWLDGMIIPYNYRLSKALSAFDMTHNFVVSYAYSLPLQRLTNRGVMGKALEGWRLAGITRFTTGLPVTLSEGDDYSLMYEGYDRPNCSNGSSIQFMNPRDNPTFAYFSTTAFTKETLGVLGNCNSRFFHGPGLNNWDLMLNKVTKFRERFSTELRFEFFNSFNHTQFGDPSGGITSSSFGSVSWTRGPRIGQVALKLYF